jgi:hypothetical protein
MLVASAGQRAQSQEVPAGSANSKTAEVAKPVRKPDWVATSDPIALLAVRREASVARDVADASGSASGAAGLRAEETARKAAEIALLEQQIREKQKRITLLMRLFVDDERAFLNDPENAPVNGAAAERRQYEQDELRWETAELAKMKARLREITAGR